MIKSFCTAAKVLLPLLVLSLVISSVAAQSNALKLEVQLIWGTNDDKSSDPKHKPIDPGLAKKMEGGPFKWKHYFEINHSTVEVAEGATKKLTMSPKCDVELKNLGAGKIEAKLYGSGKFVCKQTHAISAEPLLVGGPAPGDTSWFVVVKKAK